MENSLHGCDECMVIIRTCHLVTMSVQTKGSHRGTDKHPVSYGEEQGKKFSGVAMGLPRGHGVVTGHCMARARAPKIRACLSQTSGNRTAQQRPWVSVSAPKLWRYWQVLHCTVLCFLLTFSIEDGLKGRTEKAVVAGSHLAHLPLQKTHILWTRLWIPNVKAITSERSYSQFHISARTRRLHGHPTAISKHNPQQALPHRWPWRESPPRSWEQPKAKWRAGYWNVGSWAASQPLRRDLYSWAIFGTHFSLVTITV